MFNLLVLVINFAVIFTNNYMTNSANLPLMNPKIHNRIMGGHIVDIEDFPYQVSYQPYKEEKTHACGGSIISERFFLTAAHCVYKKLCDFCGRIRYGSSYCDKGGKIAEVKYMIRHHKYSGLTIDYDVAVGKLKGSLVFDSKCQPVKLANTNEVIEDGTMLVVSGFGAYSTNDTKDDEILSELRAVDVPKMNNTICKMIMENNSHNASVTPRMICAGYNWGEKDSCQGDSGGPLVLEVLDMKIQVGIVSWGIGCALPGFFGVYADVASLRDWIRDKSGV